MAKNLDWQLYRSFLVVMQQGSLSAAARWLGIAQPTVGRHIAALEQALGVKLFTRSTDGLLPTRLALDLLPHAEQMANMAAVLERMASQQFERVSGRVRITASEVMAVEVLPAILASMHQQYPGLKLEILPSNQAQDLLHREADLAVRMFRPGQQQLVIRRVGVIELGLYANRNYLQRQGRPSTTADLAQHALIGFDQPNEFIRQALKKLPFSFERSEFAFSTDSDLTQLALLRSGAGIGFCQVPLAVADERLERLFPDHFSLGMDTYVTFHEDLRDNTACKLVADTLVDGLRQYLQA